MGFIVNPGLVPIIKAISQDIRGRPLIVTRKIAARDDDRGVVAHVEASECGS